MNSAEPITGALPDRAGTAASLVLAAKLAGEFFHEARAGEFGFSIGQFAAMLAEIGAKYLPPAAGERELAEFCSRLRLRELALARACAAGNGKAWDEFLTRYRESIYRSALAIAGANDVARELADSIYADLYGLASRGGERLSKLAYYDGRGSLEGWLRSVLAHEHLNRWRSGRRTVSLEEQVEAGTQFADPQTAAGSSSYSASDSMPDSRVVSATDEALAELSAEERYLLASYYLDRQTLAEIGDLLGVHESTISRRLDRITGALMKRIVKGMRQRGMSRDQAREALETDVRDLAVDVRRHLLGARNPSGAVLSKETKESR